MKRILIIAGFSILGLLAIGLLGIHLWIGKSVRNHIEIARAKYPGSAEDALIALMTDPGNSYYVRTHKGVWTLGQIRSEKALPILKEAFRNDPKGETCIGKHDSMLCQYEIHKAIQAIEQRSPFNHQKLKDK